MRFPGLDAVYMGWQHAGYNTLVQQARQVTSQAERLRLYAQTEQILVEEAPLPRVSEGGLFVGRGGLFGLFASHAGRAERAGRL